MLLFHQLAAAALLLILTLWLQCAGVAALIEWQRRGVAHDMTSARFATPLWLLNLASRVSFRAAQSTLENKRFDTWPATLLAVSMIR